MQVSKAGATTAKLFDYWRNAWTFRTKGRGVNRATAQRAAAFYQVYREQTDDRALHARDPAFLDLVQQRLVTHAEDLCGLAAVPMHLPQRLFDRGALRPHRSRLRDRRERSAAG